MNGRVVLTDLTADGTGVLVIPLDIARRELTTYALLARADSFEALAADPEAARVVLGCLDTYVERLVRDGEVSSGYDPESFFGEDNWRVWRAEPRATSTTWLLSAHPDLFERFTVPDTAWGFDYDPVPYVRPEDSDELIRHLVDRGYEVRNFPQLEVTYVDADLQALPADGPLS